MRRDSRRVRCVRVGMVMALAAGLFAVVAGPSSADVTSVQGGAVDYLTDISLFGGPRMQRGPAGTPGCDPNQPIPGPGGTATEACNLSVTLPETGGNQSLSDPDGATARYGPAIIFSRGPATVSTEGTTGATGSVTSSTDIQNVNASGEEVFTASRVQSTCTASESGASGSTTITGGTLRISEGDPDVEGDDTNIDIPVTPAVNETHTGTVEAVGDTFEYIFNEHITNPDGSLTVYAVHGRLLGPSAVGDVFIGRVDCGVTATGGGPTTTQPPGVTTTQPPGVTTTQPPGVTTTQPPGVTTTQPSGVTTTTRPGGTTTTTRAGGTTTTVRATTTVPVSAATTVPPSQHAQTLVRTGSRFQSLIVLAFLTMVLGALALIGFGSRLASAGPGSGSGPWAGLVRRAAERHRRRRPWNRRYWS
jgi:hypothetical protein